MNGAVTLSVNADEFARGIQNFAAATTHSFEEAFRIQGRLLAAELMKRTPPFSGKTISRILAARGQSIGFRDAEIEDMTAFQVGKRRVEKDIRKVIYGVRGVAFQSPVAGSFTKAGKQRTAKVTVYSPLAAATDWGTLQKCEGKMAVRIFATKGGNVYGVDYNEFKPNPSMGELAQHHQENRGKRGRVTMAGQKTRDIGRWKWLDVWTTKESIVKQFVSFKQKMVGQGKGGWAAFFTACGGKIGRGGWVGRHEGKAGSCRARFAPNDVSILAINKSAWASGGDPERIIEKSMAGRAKMMVESIGYELKKRWDAGGRRMAA